MMPDELLESSAEAEARLLLGEDGHELASLMRQGQQRLVRQGQQRLVSEQRERSQRARQRNTRWTLFCEALLFLSRVLVDLGRRALRIIERNVPIYIALVDRCLVCLIRVSVRPKKNVTSPRLLLLVCLVFAVPYILITLHRFQSAIHASDYSMTHELTEESIRPTIMVELLKEPAPTKRQARLRDGGDGLQVDDTKSRCDNTVQGVRLVTDSMGFVCTRQQLDSARQGCCNESDVSPPRIKQFACDQCDTNAPHCCDVYEHCVSCCMHPLNVNLRRDFLTHADPAHPVYYDPSSLTVFQYCSYRCRTSAASVQQQNSYRSRRTYCYGIHRPLKMLPTVNSDDLNEDWKAVDQAVENGLVQEEWLEHDPMYLTD